MRYLIRLTYFTLFASLLLSCSSSKEAAKAEGEGKADEKSSLQHRALFHEANKEKILGNYSEAEKLFRQLLENEPDNATVHYELARVIRKQNKESEALRLAEKAVELDPGNTWFKLYLAELYEDNNKIDEAVELVEELLAQDPDNEDYYHMLAGAYMLKGQRGEALDILNRLESKFGPDEDIILQKKELYLREGKFSKAVEEMRKLIRHSPRDTRYLSILAEMYMQEEDYDEAFKLYREVQEIDPGDPYIHMSLAEYYRRTGDNDASFVELRKGFANPRLDIDTKVKILMSFYAVGEVYEEMRPQGLELTNILVATHPGDAKAHSVRADFLSRDKRYPEARDALLRVISIDSSKYVVWEQLLRIELQLKKFSDVTSHADRAIDLFPSMPLLYLFKGIGAYNIKEYQKAASAFDLGSKLVVDNPKLKMDFFTYAADTYQELGEYQRSSRYYEKVLEYDEDNVYVLNNYSYFLALRKENLEKAAGMALRANELEPGNSSYEDTYAWVLYMQGKYEEAKIWLEKALSNSGSNSDVILEHYGDVLYKLGEQEKAREYWLKALEHGEGSEFLQKKADEGKLYE